MKNGIFLKLTVLALVIAAMLSAALGCGDKTPDTTDPTVTSPDPSASDSAPNVSSTDEKIFNITYDLDGGIDGGNPSSYNSLNDTPILAPVKVGYDFIGWTGTGITEPTVSLTLKAGTEGDVSLKANWEENGEFTVNTEKNPDDLIAKVFSGKAKAAFIITDNTPAPYILEARAYQDLFINNDSNFRIVMAENLQYGASYDFKVYLGVTGEAASDTLINSLNYIEYAVEVGEDYVSIVGWNEKANAAAFDIFDEIIGHVAAGGRLSDFAGATFKGVTEGVVGADIPMLDGYDAVTDVGEDAFHVYKLDATKDEYEGYLAKLEKAGYTKYTDNKMGDIAYASTYVSEDTVVTVNFTEGSASGKVGRDVDRSLRVVVEPLANTALPSLEKAEDTDANVTVCSVAMLDHKIIQDGNICLVFQLSNGHFIIVDSNCNGTQKGLLDYLRSKAPDKNNVVIDAWILTHFHQDHIGGFIDYTGLSNNMRYTTVKSVIYNFPSEQVLSTAAHSTVDMSNINFFYNKRRPNMEKDGTVFYQARTGQKYSFGNAEIEILWTFEDIMPHNIYVDRSNPTCIGFSITIAGQKHMITGDSSVEEFTAAYLRYGEYLKSDFVQLSHHGYGDYPSTSVTNLATEFYQKVNAPYVLNSGMGLWYGNPERWAMENATVYFLRDELGNCIIPLPYSGGDYEAELKK